MTTRDKIKTMVFISLIILIGYFISKNQPSISSTPNDGFPKTLIVINETEYSIIPPTKIMLHEILCRDSVSVKFEYMSDELMSDYAAFIIEDFFFKSHYIEHDKRPHEMDAMEREEETYFKIFNSVYK